MQPAVATVDTEEPVGVMLAVLGEESSCYSGPNSPKQGYRMSTACKMTAAEFDTHSVAWG